MNHPVSTRRVFACAVEILESRIAPAAIAHYTDVDGDKVTVTSSTGVSFDLGNALHVTGGQLQSLELKSATFGGEFVGANITFTVVKAAGGDGLANVGYIDATGVDLGTVTVLGDLGRIDAGNMTTSTPGVKALTAKSLGRFGVDTQAAGGNLTSNIKGALSALTVAGDVTGVFINVTGSGDGKIGPITIGGSLIGGNTANTGEIFASGDIGAVKIGHDVQGGSASFSGFIFSFTGKIASLAIGGSLVGGSGDDTGTVGCEGDIGVVTIGGDVQGGSGGASGFIQSANGGIASVMIAGSLIGGQTPGAANVNSGGIEADGDIGAVIIGHNVQGGTATSGSGFIKADTGTIGSVSITGSLLGGTGKESGEISAQGDIGAITIGHDVLGGTAISSAFIGSNTGKIASLTIKGSLIGGTKMGSGEIVCVGDIGAVKIGQNVQGGAGTQSGFLRTVSGKIANLAIGGSLTGGTVGDSGEIIAHAGIGAVTIGHDLQGGAASQTGRVQTESGKIASVTINGSLIGGSGGSHTGEIVADGDLGAVKIGQNVQGGSGNISGIINSANGKIASVSIGGSLIGGAGVASGEIFCSGDIGPITIKHEFQGGSLDGAGLIRSFNGKIASVAIGGSFIGGSGTESGEIVSHGDLGLVTIGRDMLGGSMSKAGRINVESGKLAGINIGGSLIGGSAGNAAEILCQGDIGAITIGRDMLGGSGVGSANVQSSTGKIASVTIGGSLVGGSTNNSGEIISTGDLGAVKIGHDLQGGAGSLSGFIQSTGGKIASVAIGGSLVGWQLAGAVNLNSGEIISNGNLGPVTVGHDVQGGTSDESGTIKSDSGKIASVTIGGSLIGGSGGATGAIFAGTDLGQVKIGRDLRGGTGGSSGFIRSIGGKIAGVTVGGSLVGGSIAETGKIVAATDLGPVTIGRDLLGGAGTDSGELRAGSGSIASVSIGGSFLGGSGTRSASIISGSKNIGAVKIGQDFRGSSGQYSAEILADAGTLGSVTIGGSYIGGAKLQSGNISANSGVGAVTIGHDFVGGSATNTGVLFCMSGKIASVTIGGSLIGGSADDSGGITSGGALGPVKVGRDIVGGSITGNGSLSGSGLVLCLGHLDSVTVGGSIISGIDDSTGSLQQNAAIVAVAGLGSLAVTGSIIGNNTGSPVNVIAGGQTVKGPTTDVAIGKINVGGRVEYANIVGGYNQDLTTPTDGDAQIGAVTVGGDWIASNLVAGAKDGGNGKFGDADDVTIGAGSATITAKIASIVIGGRVVGTPSPATADHFGFVAQQIGSFHAGLFVAALTAGTDGPIELSLPTGDVTIREVA